MSLEPLPQQLRSLLAVAARGERPAEEHPGDRGLVGETVSRGDRQRVARLAFDGFGLASELVQAGRVGEGVGQAVDMTRRVGHLDCGVAAVR
jgi:hypothetical protein